MTISIPAHSAVQQAEMPQPDPVSLWGDILDPAPEKAPAHLTCILDSDTVPGRTLRGHTAFFRHMPAYDEYLDCAARFAQKAGRPATIGVFGGSVGAEMYTLLYRAADRGLLDSVRVTSQDMSQKFTTLAAKAVYPAAMFADFAPEVVARFVDDYLPGFVKVKARFRAHADVLPAAAVQAHDNDNRMPVCDVAVLSNILGYMDFEGKGAAITAAALRARHAVALYVGFNDTVTTHLNAAHLHPDDGNDGFTRDHVWNRITAYRPVIAYKDRQLAHPR